MSDLWIVNRTGEWIENLPRFTPFDRDAAQTRIGDPLRRPIVLPVRATRVQVMRWEQDIRNYEATLREIAALEPVLPKVEWE